MLDPLRVKLITESASGLASASISPSKATRNWVGFACVTCYEMLRFSGLLKIWNIFDKFLMNKWLWLYVISSFFRQKLTQLHGIKELCHNQLRSRFPQNPPFCPLFGPFYPHFASHGSASCRGHLLPGTEGKKSPHSLS